MAYKKGNEFVVYVERGGAMERVACSKSCSIEMKTATIDTSSPDSGIWKTSIMGKSEWAIKVNGLIKEERNDLDLWEIFVSRETLTICYIDVGGDKKAWTGAAYMTNLQQSAGLRETATYSAEFEGSGSLEVLTIDV